jgi:hypothetical protein
MEEELYLCCTIPEVANKDTEIGLSRNWKEGGYGETEIQKWLLVSLVCLIFFE